MKQAQQKMISLTEKQNEMLRRMSYQSKLTASKLIQTMIEIVNQSDINLSMVIAAAKADGEDLRHLRIMSDGQKKAPTYEFEDDAKPRGMTLNNNNTEPEESLEELLAKL